MKNHAADELDMEEFFADHTPGRLANVGKRLRQQVVQRFARRITGFQLVRFCAQFLIGLCGILCVQSFNFIDNRFDFFQFVVAVRPKQLFNCLLEHVSSSFVCRAPYKKRPADWPPVSHTHRNTSILYHHRQGKNSEKTNI